MSSSRAAGHHRGAVSPDQYEYYISYFGVERRNDRWVMGTLLRENEGQVKADEIKYEEAMKLEKAAE